MNSLFWLFCLMTSAVGCLSGGDLRGGAVDGAFSAPIQRVYVQVRADRKEWNCASEWNFWSRRSAWVINSAMLIEWKRLILLLNTDTMVLLRKNQFLRTLFVCSVLYPPIHNHPKKITFKRYDFFLWHYRALVWIFF